MIKSYEGNTIKDTLPDQSFGMPEIAAVQTDMMTELADREGDAEIEVVLVVRLHQPVEERIEIPQVSGMA